MTLLGNVNRASWLLVSRRMKMKRAPAPLLGIFRVTAEYPATLSVLLKNRGYLVLGMYGEII